MLGCIRNLWFSPDLSCGECLVDPRVIGRSLNMSMELGVILNSSFPTSYQPSLLWRGIYNQKYKLGNRVASGICFAYAPPEQNMVALIRQVCLPIEATVVENRPHAHGVDQAHVLLPRQYVWHPFSNLHRALVDISSNCMLSSLLWGCTWIRWRRLIKRTWIPKWAYSRLAGMNDMNCQTGWLIIHTAPKPDWL